MGSDVSSLSSATGRVGRVFKANIGASPPPELVTATQAFARSVMVDDSVRKVILPKLTERVKQDFGQSEEDIVRILGTEEGLKNCLPLKKWRDQLDGLTKDSASTSTEEKHCLLAAEETISKGYGTSEYRPQTHRKVKVFLALTGDPNWFFRTAARQQQLDFNALHAAVQIGNFFVDWFTTSLTYPREVFARRALVSIELGTVSIEDDSPQIAALVKCMKKWNTEVEYTWTSCNCQQFAEEALAAMGFNLPKTGAIYTFLERVKQGDYRLTIPELKDLYPLTTNTFESHKDLDDEVAKLFNSFVGGPTAFRLEHEEIWILLKSFDRGFRIAHESDAKNTRGAFDRKRCPFPLSFSTAPDGTDNLVTDDQ